MTEYETLQWQLGDDGVATIALDQPESRNALGERVSARRAQELGIVNAVVAPDELEAKVAAWASALAAKSPLLMRLGKDALWRQDDLPVEDAWQLMRSQLTIAFSTEDMQEGVRAFFEKREPAWTGR